MQFLYHPDAGSPTLRVEGEAYRYLFKVRRRKVGETVALRHLRDDVLYSYRIEHVSRREADLTLLSSEERAVTPPSPLHLGWCVIEPKTIEKTLPMLNELGVGKISFVYCDRSQNHFKLDFERFERILINSSQQCGRSRIMELERFESLEAYLRAYPQSAILDFGGEPLPCERRFGSILIGCEGGFSERERRLFAGRALYGLPTPLILRSETAAVTAAARGV